MMAPLTVLVMLERAYGPTNNCTEIGDVLHRRGHRVAFAAETSWKGRLEPLGFEDDLVDLAPPGEADQDAGQFWKDFVRRTASEFRKPTIGQLDTWIRPVWEELISGAVLPVTAGRDHRPELARRDRGRQRGELPGSDDCERAVPANHVL